MQKEQAYTLTSLTATDALGRTLPRYSGYKKGKYVGVFYFLWHGQHDADKVRNVTELLKTDYEGLFDTSTEKTTRVPYDSWLHYQEPLYGYYNSLDEWVMRKHIELFLAAGVDFLVMDYTNGVCYDRPLRNLMELLLEYKAAGWNVPKITFYVNVKPQELTEKLYREVYCSERYRELVFYGNGEKPLLISVPHLLSAEMNEFFDVRASQWYRTQYGDRTWPYWEFTRKWHKYTDMVNVSLAQSGTSFSFTYESHDGTKHENWGRGYSTAHPQNGDVNAILRGENFQEGWDEAIKLDPDYVFITGWNEWVMQKMNLHTFFPDIFKDDFPCYTDNFNVEYSRDAEMTRIPDYKKGADGTYEAEGYGDNFLMQLIANIRRFKGLPAASAPDSEKGAERRYTALSTAKTARDADGFYRNTHYEQAKPEHFIQAVTVRQDAKKIYFRIETEEAIQPRKDGQTNRMNLFLGIENSALPAWESYQYVVNRHPLLPGTKTLVERFVQDGSFVTAPAGEADIRVQGNVLELAVPRSLPGLNGEKPVLLFKVADGVEKEDDILDYYVSGESFPLGRMAYRYEMA